ncbi:MAG: flippase-like domain-containing protein [Dysgonamonadaceae bacterium]|jgi:uncharacterized protein (TIRG00374 family)|nr:flippase-like domain-containing protein [Dysgonamonadaceae bacterium]
MDKNLKQHFIKFIKTFLPLLFGLLVLWLTIGKLDFEQVGEVLKNDVNYWFIALSLPFGLFANIIRGYRWELLIRPLGYKPRKSNIIYSVLGTYGVNLAFPRLGEIWRCTMITRYENIPFTKALGTMLTDRISDSVTVALITVAAFAMNVPFFRSFFEKYPEIYSGILNIITYPWFWAAISGTFILIWQIFEKFGEVGIIKKIKQLLLNIKDGIFTIGKMENKWLFIFYTFLIWFGYFLYFYICFFAFPFTKDFGWNYGLIGFVMGSIAMGVPVQGGIGPWHFMIGATLMAFGVSAVNAGAFALCVHTIQAILWTGLFGIFGVLALPIANRKS